MKTERRLLIKPWLKITTFIFTFITFISLLSFPLSGVEGMHLSLYGLPHNSEVTFSEQILIAILSMIITVGFIGLYTTQSWAPRYLKIIAIALILYYILRFIISLISGLLEIRFEPFLIIFFLIKLQPLIDKWN
ncbi:MAG: hypothetical protein P8X89_19560 [Reinekea sp.]